MNSLARPHRTVKTITDFPPRRSIAREVVPPSTAYLRTKAACDWVVAVVLLVLAAPVIAVTALVVKATSPGPALYTQKRVGHRGRVFTIYKLRTMHHNCELASGVRWATACDPRVTPVGNFLRKTHLDELPQLWNVIRGEMSLVGPRPERPELVGKLEAAIPLYGERLLVRPGVTGLAQVQIPADTDLDSVRRKLKYDLYYIENLGLGLDLRLVLGTVFKMFHVPFGVTRLLLRIPARPVVEAEDEPTELLPTGCAGRSPGFEVS